MMRSLTEGEWDLCRHRWAEEDAAVKVKAAVKVVAQY